MKPKPFAQPFRTRSHSVAAFLRYSLGDGFHTATTAEANSRARFEFLNSPELSCEELTELYHNNHLLEVSDARRLLNCLHAIQQTISDARRGDGTWRNEL
jgi:hypothetical protein